MLVPTTVRISPPFQYSLFRNSHSVPVFIHPPQISDWNFLTDLYPISPSSQHHLCLWATWQINCPGSLSWKCVHCGDGGKIRRSKKIFSLIFKGKSSPYLGPLMVYGLGSQTSWEFENQDKWRGWIKAAAQFPGWYCCQEWEGVFSTYLSELWPPEISETPQALKKNKKKQSKPTFGFRLQTRKWVLITSKKFFRCLGNLAEVSAGLLTPPRGWGSLTSLTFPPIPGSSTIWESCHCLSLHPPLKETEVERPRLRHDT